MLDTIIVIGLLGYFFMVALIRAFKDLAEREKKRK